MLKTTLSAAAIFFMTIYGAYAETGNELLNKCKYDNVDNVDGGAFYDVMFCMGFVTAVATVLSGDLYDWFRACFPNSGEITKEQLKDIVVAFLEKYPERRHHNALLLSLHAFTEAFPCQ